MSLCPVDLAECAREECAGGYCMRESEPHVILCWECGEIVDRRGHHAGICVACLTLETAG